ncbi:hypothetical protein [uncultured Kordia sp.]|uniref:hypothetical protein n=1 Tax=uncultured Kordia sp. TaxID=507699 RepID=UPI00262D4D0D|nr:hypothetical protein [uncultured Kordia sp.]
MKRSRDSRYDKKRSRDKKDDKRKLKFSTKSTESRDKNERSRSSNKDERRKLPEKRTPKSEIQNVPKEQPILQEKVLPTPERSVDYEVFSQGDKKYQERTTHRKKKSGYPKIALPLAVVGILFLFRILLNIGGSDSGSSSTNIPERYDPVYEDRVTTTTTTPTRKRKKINAAAFIIGKGKRLREITQLEKDSTIPIIPNVKVRLFKGFHVYDSKEFPSIPILASYSKYHFFYDVQKKNPEQSMSEQWSIIREKLAERAYKGYFVYQYPKEYKVDDLLINETEFSISTKGNIVYGVATLVEYKNKRYFFQFISKEKEDKEPNYNYLRKYLNYYLKIKAANGSYDSADDLSS